MTFSAVDRRHMAQALALAARGQGSVEPNPQVGCVIARGEEVIAEGWHRQFGGPHAEIEALQVAGESARGATLYVMLEPCCHHGKTPPCTEAIIRAGVARVVVALADPFSQVAGRGIKELQSAGSAVETGLLAAEARVLLAPYLKLVERGRPWVIAKWAMTLDGRIATAGGESKWISSETSRAVVHQIRGRVDAVLVGRQTLLADDPLLTARPAGPRIATRIVLDTQAHTPLDAQLVRTAAEAPVLIAVGAQADPARCRALQEEGCEVFHCAGDAPAQRLAALLNELGRRRMTNLLVEGGSRVLGSLRDLDEIDEVHVFIGPQLLGQAGALSPIAGSGAADLVSASRLTGVHIEQLDQDCHFSGRVNRYYS